MTANPAGVVRPGVRRADPERSLPTPASNSGGAFGTLALAIGWLLIILSSSMLLPAAVDLHDDNPDWQGFVGAAVGTMFIGVATVLATRQPRRAIDVRTGFLLTTITWLAMGLFGSLPFQLGTSELSFTDAIFETVSGLTTTGSTVMSDLDSAPRGILIWRALLQFLGGIGIVVIALVMLPFLRVGGMQLFRSESSDKSDKLLPSTGAIVSRLFAIYVGLALACALALHNAGLGLFDALCHAMTAVSTGGFGTKDASIGAFASPTIEWLLILFMFLGGLPFMRYLAIVQGKPGLFWHDSQIRLFLALCLAATLLLAVWLIWSQGRHPLDALRTTLFNVVSIITTTGFANEDYQLWGAPAIGLFLAITVVGGCTGSTSGGIKIFRIEILWKASLRYLQSLIFPNRANRMRHAGRPVDVEIVVAVLSFVFFFIGAWGVVTVILCGLGLDLVTSISAAATALANVGPGLGEIIGPSGNFRSLSDPTKWVLTFAMLLGRLEFFTVLVLLHPAFWKR